MRVTPSSQYVGFTRQVGRIQAKKNAAQVRISSGKEVINLSDSPEKVIDIKLFDKKISQNDKYQDVLDMTLSELYNVDELLDGFTQILNQARTVAVDAANEDSVSLQALGSYFRGYLEDLVQIANSDFQGHFLFAGTKTTVNSIEDASAGSSSEPFEIIKNNPTVENPSGLSVDFYGNNNDRIINKSSKTTEKINLGASELFGENQEVFSYLADLVNMTEYNEDGSKRGDQDVFTQGDLTRLDKAQKGLMNSIMNINRLVARNGTKVNRLEIMRTQLSDENVRLMDYRSIRQDSDVAEAAMNLQREEYALQYTLQVGARMNQISLFDFIR